MEAKIKIKETTIVWLEKMALSFLELLNKGSKSTTILILFFEKVKSEFRI
jgi:hypothetical protein